MIMDLLFPALNGQTYATKISLVDIEKASIKLTRQTGDTKRCGRTATIQNHSLVSVIEVNSSIKVEK
jgi:hypothetical protein